MGVCGWNARVLVQVLGCQDADIGGWGEGLVVWDVDCGGQGVYVNDRVMGGGVWQGVYMWQGCARQGVYI